MVREARNCGLDVDDPALGRELRDIGALLSIPAGRSTFHFAEAGGFGELLPMKHYSWDDGSGIGVG